MSRANNDSPAAKADFPSLMNDLEIDQAREQRRADPHDPFVREEKPDPWPLVERSFPRIAATIRQLWGKRALDEYFAKLVVNERGERQGFPPDILAAILEIAWLHNERFRFPESGCPWEADVSQRKWWSRG
jgi:hypothetical protein